MLEQGGNTKKGSECGAPEPGLGNAAVDNVILCSTWKKRPQVAQDRTLVVYLYAKLKECLLFWKCALCDNLISPYSVKLIN